MDAYRHHLLALRKKREKIEEFHRAQTHSDMTSRPSLERAVQAITITILNQQWELARRIIAMEKVSKELKSRLDAVLLKKEKEARLFYADKILDEFLDRPEIRGRLDAHTKANRTYWRKKYGP
jgi:predicted HTH domain antitoxin